MSRAQTTARAGSKSFSGGHGASRSARKRGKQAPTAKAAAAHAYLAAAYSAQVSKELARQAELEALLLQIH